MSYPWNMSTEKHNFQELLKEIYKRVNYNGSVSNSRPIFGTAESSIVHQPDTSFFKLFIVEVRLLSHSSKIVNHICCSGSKPPFPLYQFLGIESSPNRCSWLAQCHGHPWLVWRTLDRGWQHQFIRSQGWAQSSQKCWIKVILQINWSLR